MRFRFFVLFVMISLLPQAEIVSADDTKNASEREFCKLDKNNDREITFEEFKDCEFYKLEHVKALIYSESGQNGKTSLSDEELKAYLFKKADKNKNNKIDRKEWEEFYNSVMDPSGGSSNGGHDVH